MADAQGKGFAPDHASGDGRSLALGVGEAVSNLAAATSLAIIALGLVQLFAPAIAAPFTGMERGLAASVLAVQWTVLGVMLAVGGILRKRLLVLFAADFLLIGGVSASVVMMLGQPEMLPLAMHGVIALVGLLNGGLVRLTGRADPERGFKIGEGCAPQSAAPPAIKEMDD